MMLPGNLIMLLSIVILAVYADIGGQLIAPTLEPTVAPTAEPMDAKLFPSPASKSVTAFHVH